MSEGQGALSQFEKAMLFDRSAHRCPRMGLGRKKLSIQMFSNTVVLVHAAGVEPDSQSQGDWRVKDSFDVG